jgi:hypothetical protein
MKEANTHWQIRWFTMAQTWQRYLSDAGLGEIAGAISQAFKPLAPFAAQVLWFSQPAFALFGQFEAISSLAELLDNPQYPDLAETGE